MILPLFSVIIPVYKVEQYLHQCVDSVLVQDFEDFEIILVDDGSPDNCPQICDEYASKDQRIKVIHKENGGLSDARNFGIEAATGSYLLFMDSDDYWEGTSALSDLYVECSHAYDVVLYGTKDINADKNSVTQKRGNYDLTALRQDKETAICSLIKSGEFPGSAWVMAYRRGFIVQHHIEFKVGIKAEDIDWLLQVFTKLETISAIRNSFYMYIKNRPGSITNTADIKSAYDIMFSVTKWRPLLENNKSTYSDCLLSYLGYQYLTALLICGGVSKKNKTELYPIMNREKTISKYVLGLRGKIASFVIHTFGVEFAGFLFNIVYRLK